MKKNKTKIYLLLIALAIIIAGTVYYLNMNSPLSQGETVDTQVVETELAGNGVRDAQ